MTRFDEPRGAVFSPCLRYRYLLWRRWAAAPPVNFLMLNPSTATADTNDPTVERVERRAKAMEAGGLIVTNLFAYRSTDPKYLRRVADPIGPENDKAILEAADAASMVVCAWGTHGSLKGRSDHVRKLLEGRELHALKTTGKGEPCHPLYLSYDLQPLVYGGTLCS
jgi:hypothetical protein